MKRFLTIGAILLAIVTLAACGQDPATPPPSETVDDFENVSSAHGEIVVEEIVDTLEFSSIEALLRTYMIAKEGGARGEDIAELVSAYWSSMSEPNLIDVAVGANLPSLDTLYLPVGIPSDYRLHRIRVSSFAVSFQYFHEDDLVSEDTIQDAYWQQRYYLLHFVRWNMDDAVLLNDMLDQYNASIGDLIEGKYMFQEPNSFTWIYGGMRFNLRIPLRQHNNVDETDGMPPIAPREIVRFTETRTVDMTNDSEVRGLIEEVAAQYKCYLNHRLHHSRTHNKINP